MRGSTRLLMDVALGAVAGAAATWLMTQVTTVMYEREDPDARKREDEARGGRTAYAIASERTAGLLGVELSEEEQERYASVFHWGIGIGMGALYGALHARYPGGTWLRGLGFGVAFFLVVDELGNTALGLTPPPNAFPWQAHARGLAGHAVYGIATDLALRMVTQVGEA